MRFLRRSREFRAKQNWRELIANPNAAWASVEYLFYPILQLVATPVMVHYLGVDQFGLWVFIGALSGFGGAASLGMSVTATRFVAMRIASGDVGGVAAVVRQCTLISLISTMVFVVCLIPLGWSFFTKAFHAAGTEADQVLVLVLAAAILVFQQVDAVFAASIKGAERFETAAKLEIVLRTLIIGGSLVATIIFANLIAVLVATSFAAAFAIMVRATVTQRIIGGRIIAPTWDRAMAKELFRFGLWSSLQGIGGILFHNLDRLLLGVTSGPVTLAYYAASLQVAQQIHAIPAAALAFLMPRVAALGGDGRDSVKKLRYNAIVANLVLVVILFVPFWLGGRDFIGWWLGADFANASYSLLGWLLIAYGLLAINVAPHYLLIGAGRVKDVSILNLVSGVIGAALMLGVVPSFGPLGAAASRGAYGVALLLGYIWLMRERQ